jgi:hypothetical protein
MCGRRKLELPFSQIVRLCNPTLLNASRLNAAINEIRSSAVPIHGAN